MKKSIKMPKISANMENGVIVSWNKEPNDKVEKGEILFELETDKVVSEIESSEEGVLREVFFEEGDLVKVDEILAIIESAE